MARLRTAGDLVYAVRRNTDNRDSQQFVTDAEIREILNEELAELHARMTAKESQPHFRSAMTPFLTTVGQSLYPLPVDFYRLQEINAVIGGVRQNLKPFMPRERADLMNSQFFANGFPSYGPMYRLQADNIEILPNKSAVTIHIHYVRSCPRLENNTDTVDGFDGYEMAAVYGASATVREMEQIDPGYYASKKAAIMKEIDAQATLRDASAPERVEDTTGALNGWWDYQ